VLVELMELVQPIELMEHMKLIFAFIVPVIGKNSHIPMVFGIIE
jgi:hypothetical protein